MTADTLRSKALAVRHSCPNEYKIKDFLIQQPTSNL